MKSLVKEVYPSWKLDILGRVERKRLRRRPTNLPLQSKEVSTSFQVVMFKKPKPGLLPGLETDLISAFFNRLFKHGDKDIRTTTGVTLKQLINNNLSMLVLITSQENNGNHNIVAGIIFHVDYRQGIFVPYLGVLDSGDGDNLKFDSTEFDFPGDYDTTRLPSWRDMDVSKFMISMVQLVAVLMERQKQSLTMPDVLNLSSPNLSTYRVYLQSRLEENTITYAIYVVYGFQPANANRRDFMCEDYKKEIGVGNAVKTSLQPFVGLGYYADDMQLRRICLNSFMLMSCPPVNLNWKSKGLMITEDPEDSPWPIQELAYSSCLLPAVDLPMTLRLTTDSYLHIHNLARAFHSSPLKVPMTELNDLLPLSPGLFRFLDVDEITKIHSKDWKCVYTKFVKPTERGDSYQISDPRIALLGGCRIKEREDGYILGDVARAIYMTSSLTWKDFDSDEYQEHGEWSPFTMPEDGFGSELQQNLMGFYYRLSRIPAWTPATHKLALIIAAEYEMRVKLGFESDYDMKEGESFNFSFETTNVHWRHNFQLMGYRLDHVRPVTLWSDLFALTIMFSHHKKVSVMFQPCFCEMQHKSEDQEALLRLRVLSPTLMEDLQPCGKKFPSRGDGGYLIIPVFLFNHNPSLIQSRISVIHEYTKMAHQEYRMKLFKFLVDPPTEPFYKDSTDVPSEPVRFFSETEEDEECTYDMEELKKQVGTMKRAISVPVTSQVAAVALIRFSDKDRAANDRKLKRDAVMDELNPSYMYPDLGAPYSDRYLNHAKPAAGKWLNTEYPDLEDGFVPPENHVYLQKEIDALANEAPTEKKQPRPVALIIQEATSMRSNVHMKAGQLGNVMEMEGEYTDQEYINLACMVDPGRELRFKTDQKTAPKMIMVLIDSLVLPPRKTLDHYTGGKAAEQLKRKSGTKMLIFKSWLKNYLDYFDPGFYETIITAIEGTQVEVLKGQLGSDNPEDYQFAGQLERHEEIVPLTKGHRMAIPDTEFVDTYGTNTSLHNSARYRTYNKKFAKACNPSPDGETMSLLPFPKCRTRVNDPVPEIYYQITGVRVEVREANKREKDRWLGIQNSRYVALPWEWVEKNIHPSIIKEAVRRGVAKCRGSKKSGESSAFIKLPPGDARDDDPQQAISDVAKDLITSNRVKANIA